MYQNPDSVFTKQERIARLAKHHLRGFVQRRVRDGEPFIVLPERYPLPAAVTGDSICRLAANP
jgi:hypothetical protein